MRHQRGFTLIEILVAVAIFGIISVAAYTVLDSGLRTQQHAEERLAHLAELQRLFYNLSQDVSYLTQRRSRDDLGDQESIIYGESDLSGDTFTLAFNRANWRNPAKFPRSHLQHVEYRFEEEKIYRRYRVYLDAAPNSPEVDRVMASDIESVRLEFRAPDGAWSDGWGQFSEMRDKLPRAMRIRITSKLVGEIERYYFLPYSLQQTQVALK